MSTFPVKFISSTMRGAPVINGTTPGGFLVTLKALLVSGWGALTASTVTVTDEIATATFPSGSFEVYAVILISGASSAALNGEARVLTAGANTITFAAPGVPNGAVSGTISIKYAPAGWEEPYSATDVSAFRSTYVTGSRFWVRVDDTGGQIVRLRGYESMPDIGTGAGPFPSDAQVNGGGRLFKSERAAAGAVPYLFLADSRRVLWAMQTGAPFNGDNTAAEVGGFGDAIGGDAYAVFLSAGNGSIQYYELSAGALTSTPSSTPNGACYFARAPSGATGAVAGLSYPYVGGKYAISGADSTLGAAPTNEGRMLLSRRYFDVSGYRAEVPAVYSVPQSGAKDRVTNGRLYDGEHELLGRKLRAVYSGFQSFSAPTGVYFLDMTGPWE